MAGAGPLVKLNCKRNIVTGLKPLEKPASSPNDMSSDPSSPSGSGPTSPGPLKAPQKQSCPSLPPKCPLKSASSSDKKSCPLDDKKVDSKSCLHASFLNKSLDKKPVSFPAPICKEIARSCPYMPSPMVCHDLCPCYDVPDVIAGPRCPFSPPEPAYPAACPLEQQPDCPLVQKPKCMWKPSTPPECPFDSSNNGNSTSGCAVENADICPTFHSSPNKKEKPVAKKAPANIECCAFCSSNNSVKEKCNVKAPQKSESTFHFPSCPLFEPPYDLQNLPTDKPVCPFYPSPCPLGSCDDCPNKVHPLEYFKSNPSSHEDCKSNTGCEKKPRDSASKIISNSHQVPPVANHNSPLPPGNRSPLPPLPCVLKGCLKKPCAKGETDCPSMNEKCSLFPDGRNPKENLGLCDCSYPVPSCMLDSTLEYDPAPPQYCAKDDCCMGLPDPPMKPSLLMKGPFYALTPLHPEKEATKYYFEISEIPADSSTFSPSKHRIAPQCSIIKQGEGYKRCKTVQKIMERRGPCEDTCSQYSLKDCPLDELALKIKKSIEINK